MTSLLPQCGNLADNVNSILNLLAQEANLTIETTAIEASLKKAVAPKFEIVFAGAFSAGKSMLINALLERELLYSAEGHATGTECYIEYAEPEAEKVVLTFLSEEEIVEQATALSQQLDIFVEGNITEPTAIEVLIKECLTIIEREGGESKSEKAKKARALCLLLEGWSNNRDRISLHQHNTYSMEEFNFFTLAEAASYARRGSNSAVLKKVEYYCHHNLLKDGNVLVDMPGIDAPVKKDAELTYSKVEHPDTSAVICVLKPAAAGEMTSEETELIEKMRSNLGIRDRVFYVFNRIDETWYNAQLRQRLDSLIDTQFHNIKRLYRTSGLLGFYGSQILKTDSSSRFGLDSLFADSIKGVGGEEETPQFVSEFNNYCANSGKLTRTNFKVSVNGYETPNENYTRILNEWGTPLVKQLITDSGIEGFRNAITRYLTEEKRPQLFASLAEDLQPLCQKLQKYYLQQLQELDSQPQEIETMKTQELAGLNQQLQQVGTELAQHIEREVNAIVTNEDREFESDFQQLKAKMVSCLDELLQTFSVQNAYSAATLSHPRNATAPLIAILVEALYYIANELENVLVATSEELVIKFCQRLNERIKSQAYYRHLYRLLNNDNNLEANLQQLKENLIHALVNEARTECDRYVRESPRFYDENTFSIYQFRQTLQQTSQGYDCASMVKAEPAIRQLLKLDFEPKVSATICRNFRQTVNQTLKTQLLPMAKQQGDNILQQYPQAKANLEQILEQEAVSKIARNQQLQKNIEQKIQQYNIAVSEINNCLSTMQLYDCLLPTIEIDSIVNKKVVQKENDLNNSHYEFEPILNVTNL